MASMEKSRKELAGEYERVQKKAFTAWVNSHLLKVGQKINDLYEDLKDGTKLLLLLELITEVKLPREKGKLRFHKMQNIQTALDFLQKDRKIKLVNIRADEIVDGNPKLILGLTWTLILHFQISHNLTQDQLDRPTSPQEISAKVIKEQLLEWVQKATEGYDDVKVTNFHNSWSDGLAFCAIIDRHRPDILDFDDCDPDTPLENLERAFKVAEDELSIIRIVDPEDICVPKPDDKTILTYVSFLHHAFPEMPPPRKRKGVDVSLDDYKELYETTQKWIDDKTQQAKSRDFPNTPEQLKARMAELEKLMTKGMPVKQRDMSALSDMYNKLQSQKRKKSAPPPVPSDLEYSDIESNWKQLKEENEECKKAMEEELNRLEDLDSLADKVNSECASLEKSTEQLEKKINEFKDSCTSLSPTEVASKVEEFQKEIEALEKSVSDLDPDVQKLKEGQYHDAESVEKRVNSLASRLAALSPHLKEVSSVADEAQAVVAMETNLEELEVWLVSCGKFSNNQQIIAQIDEHNVFQLNQLAEAEKQMSRINQSPPPPGLEEKVTDVNSRWNQVVKQTKDRIAAFEPVIETVCEFDENKNPLAEWCTQQQEYFESLPPLEVTEEQLKEQQAEFETLKADIEAHGQAVNKLEEVSEKFLRDTDELQSLADRYARKLKSRDSFSKSVKLRVSEEEPMASLGEQAGILQSQWEWLKNQASAQAELISDLLVKLGRFNLQYGELEKFVREGRELLDSEKPVGESASRIQEQMKTCQDFRSQITDKQPEVDAMLAIGRTILSEPRTNSQNDTLMQKLTGFIEDWSNLQLDWQNWYNELHANTEKSKGLTEQLDKFEHDIDALEPACANLFPATVTMEALDSQLSELKEKFQAEVLDPYEEHKATCEVLKSSASLLSDSSRAETTFKKFDNLSTTVEGYKQELSDVTSDVDGWWGGCEGVTQWMSEAEKTLSGHKPLASSVDIVKEQKTDIEKLFVEVETHKDEVEKVLKALGELVKHDKLLNPDPITSFRDSFKQRWDALCSEVENRKELSERGKTHLDSYVGESESFTGWLKGAEMKIQALGPLPRSKELLTDKCEELQSFVNDVEAHGKDLDQVETRGSDFLSCAKAYQSSLVEYKQKTSADEGSSSLPEGYIDLSVEDVSAQMVDTPVFDGHQYENGIRVVAGCSNSLRKRYDALQTGLRQHKELVDEAVSMRQEFDSCLDAFMKPLVEVEGKCDGIEVKGESKPALIQERLESVRTLEVECMALEPKLQEARSAYDLLSDLGQSEDGGSSWEGEDEALKAKEEAEKKYQDLLNRLQDQKDVLNAEFTNAQAFHGAFEDFVTWLREMERKIQRDDPLKLEEEELKKGLNRLKGIASDIVAHKPMYEALCTKCQELMDRGVQDSEDLARKLENAQQRWNAIQIVNDDIEAIEETIPKLEAFHSSYNGISSEVDDLLERINQFSVSAISSDGLKSREQALQELSSEVEKRGNAFEEVLASCDLLDTPFDHTQFENDISELQDKIKSANKAVSDKNAELKSLEKKVLPMEDLFRQFRDWLEDTNKQLEALTPAATAGPEREEQLEKAKTLIVDVEGHKKQLESVRVAVDSVLPSVEDSDQEKLNSQLSEVTQQYNTLKFNCNCYPTERWLEDQEARLCRMNQTGVMIAPLQDQLRENQDFMKSVEGYRPHIDSLTALTSEADKSGQGAEGARMAAIQQQYDNLKVLATERQSMLSSFLPSVQQYESSKGAWETLLVDWEKKAELFPPPSAKPDAIKQQIEDMMALQQTITDHEPEFVSLKREAQKLYEGPSEESGLLEKLSQLKVDQQSKEKEEEGDKRPGQNEQETATMDFENRLESLKKKCEGISGDLSSQLEKGSEFQSVMSDLLGWLSTSEDDLDGLKICDPSSSAIEAQQSKCEVMLEQLATKSPDKDSLASLFTTLVSELPAESEERESLQKQLEELNSRWTALTDQLEQHESNLEAGHSLAKGYEGAMDKLFPWVPETLNHLENLGPPPSEPEMVEKRKNQIEDLKAEYNTLASVCATCVENGQSLAEKCEDGAPKTGLETDISDLQAKWEKLNQLFGELLKKLTDALVQTQEFQSIADGLDRWMESMADLLRQQDRIAARVRLIEPQIEGFKHTLSDVSSYSSTVDQAKTVGKSLMDESDPEEKKKIEARLEALTSQFAQVESTAQARISRLEDALKKATCYEDQCGKFDKWLGETEAKIAKMEPFSIASQPLKRQLEEAEEINQEVESHGSDVKEVTKSEEDLFESEMKPSIYLCEEHLAEQDKSQQQDSSSSVNKPILPDWFERAGALEAVEVGADLRSRYDKLKLDTVVRSDTGSQLLARVLEYEEEYDKFHDWLKEEKARLDSFTPPAITIDELKTQLQEVENLQNDFKNQEDALQSVNTRGTGLVQDCKDELSQTSGRMKLSDLNDLWGDCLSGLSEREGKLKEGLTLAEKYKELHDSFESWLCDCETKLQTPLKVEGDPVEMRKQLEEMETLMEEIANHKSNLSDTIAAGHELESYTSADKASLPDLGYTSLEDRYNTLKTTVDDRKANLTQTLNQVGDLHDELDNLLSQLQKIGAMLSAHDPPRVLPADIQQQQEQFSLLDKSFDGLQSKVTEAKGKGSVFASQDNSGAASSDNGPSGADIQKILSDIDETSATVGDQLSYWRDLLTASLDTAKKFELDHSSLAAWIKQKEEELANASTVRGVPEGVEEQLKQLEALQEEISEHQSQVDALTSLGQSMMDNCSPEDAKTISNKLGQISSSFEALQRAALARKRVLDDGLAKANEFSTAWNNAMDMVSAKSKELHNLESVGVDIDTVRTQLDEYKEFEGSLATLKPTVGAVLAQGKELKENCSTQDGPFITEQLEKLNALWSKLYSDGLGRKHALEDALLQLGQFHDALAELLTWIANTTSHITQAPPPGVKVETVEAHIEELKNIESGILSHTPSVKSLNEAGEKLITSSSAENTAEIQQDLSDLNSQWESLQSLAAASRSTLEDALAKAKSFSDHWKAVVGWLEDAEKQAYGDWKPCGLPETCQVDINKHQTFLAEVAGHKESIDLLESEGQQLNPQASPEDQTMVNRLVADVKKRYDDLNFTLEEREAQLKYAKERADEFDKNFCSLEDLLRKQEEAQGNQEPIHSEVEVVKQQMEEHKEYMKELGKLETQLDDLDGWGQLLVKDCVEPDGEVIKQKVARLRALWDTLNSLGIDRQSQLEESLLSLGQFEEAYDDLWAWLMDAIIQVENAEPITGDPDAVAAQLSRHKTLQKQLGARLTSKNAVMKAGKLLIKNKTGEDRAVLKKKLQDLEKEWEKVCEVSVERQEKLENAYKKIGQFRSHLGPLRSWMAKMLPTLDESEPVHGDLETVESLVDVHNAFQTDLGLYQKSVNAANETGEHLVSEVLDDPAVTQQDIKELKEDWDNICQQSVKKQERLDEACEVAKAFEDSFADLVLWVDAQCAELQSQPPPDEDATVLQQQIDEHKELSQEVTARQPEFDKVLASGQNILQLAHPKAVPILRSKLQQLERKWLDLRTRIGARSEALASALLELHGLQDMLDSLWAWVADAERKMSDTEAMPIGGDLETVEQQLASHEAFQEEMATHQPNMDALNKAAKKRKANHPNANPEMTKKIGSLYKHWQKLWLRSSERHRQLLEARTRLKDIALARSFNFDNWRKRFTAWVDQQKLRLNDLFRRFDGNHDGMLTREEFMKALKASGLAMNQIELEKIADTFDKDRTGLINLSEIVGVLKGSKRYRVLAQESLTDAQKIDHEINNQVSKCTCAKRFKVTRVADGQYRFGDNQKLRLVRILRSTVMVRVGGGWEPLEEFLRKHDPCRASGKTNKDLRGLLTEKRRPGLATAGFTSRRATAAPMSSTKDDPVRKETTASTRKPHTTRTRDSREGTPNQDCPRHGHHVRSTPPRGTPPRGTPPRTGTSGSGSGRSTPQGRTQRQLHPPSSSSTPGQKTTAANGKTSKVSPKHTASTPSSANSSPRHAKPPPKRSHTPTGASSLDVAGHGGKKASRIPTPKSKIPTRPS